MSDLVLVARGLRAARGGRDVVHGVDLDVRRGEVVGVIGPNGAGKSTLLGALAGTVTATGGTVTRHGRVASLMQTPGLAGRSALANVELGLAWWGVPREQRRERALSALERMNAGHLAKRHSTALSGGERRRVHLARAVALGADVLLLDEPFDGLDAEAHERLRDDTVEAVRGSGSAAVVVLHDRADLWAVADRVVVLVEGRVHADAAPASLLAAPPTPEAARLMGYDGAVTTAASSTLTRSSQVLVSGDGTVVGHVRRAVATEQGQRIQVEVPGGSLWATDLDGTARVGEVVSLVIRSSVSFVVTA